MKSIRWISAVLTLVAIPGPASPAVAQGPTGAQGPSGRVAPVAEGAAPRCLSLAELQRVEDADCAHATYLALAEGRIGADEAIARLEACAGSRRSMPRPAPAPIAPPGEEGVERAARSARVGQALADLEDARLRYLESVAASHHLAGSVRSFLRSLANFGRGDERAQAVERRLAADRATLRQGLAALQRDPEVHPSLYRMARAGVVRATGQEEACREAAAGHRRLIRASAGGVVGLVVAAGAVMATGATGSMMGGIVIAAALEAVLAASLIAYTERAPGAVLASRDAARPETAEAEERRTPDPERPHDPGERQLAAEAGMAWDEGAAGAPGEAARAELPSAARGVPAVLPDALPEGEVVLPRMLDPAQMLELRQLSFEAIQHRLDEFLVSRTETSEPVVERRPAPSDAEYLRALMEEAAEALELWEEERVPWPRFGDFFVRVEAMAVGPGARAATYARARARFAAGQAEYRASADVEDVRRRMAARLVALCRAGVVPGDLVLAACGDEAALTAVLLAAVLEADPALPAGGVLGVQFVGDRLHPVLFFEDSREVESLIRGTRVRGVVGPVYHPAVLFYTFLLQHGEQPTIDLAQHLRIANPDPPAQQPEAACAPRQRGLFGRIVDGVRAMLGMEVPSRGAGDCVRATSAAAGQRAEGDGAGMERGERAADDSAAAGEGAGSVIAIRVEGQAAAADEAASQEAAEVDTRPDGETPDSSSDAGEQRARSLLAGDSREMDEQEQGESEAPILDLAEVARVTVETTEASEDAGVLKIAAWRVAADSGFSVPTARVLYADNEGALSWFQEGDRFITLSPSEVEEQRRMLEAESYPVYPTTTTCAARSLPPRRVFRRAATDGQPAEFVFCDQSESLVIFETRADARRYAGLAAPDRPVFLARLATDRLAELEAGEEMRRLHALLRDPEILRGWSEAEVTRLDGTVHTLLTFQHTLESALVQSMDELESPELRGYYFDLHRQVIQAPLFVSLAEAVYQLNRRLVSDPLQALAWADALPPRTRSGFFSLYHRLGATMRWPEQWASLERRYAGEPPPASPVEPDAAPLDFLYILGDPTRVRVDWSAESPASRASVRDRTAQRGDVRPAEAEPPEAQGAADQERVGTRGLGRAGRGRWRGAEDGNRPLQMIRIRVLSDSTRARVPAHDPEAPGGSWGRASTTGTDPEHRQPVLRVAPATFVDAALSAWETDRLDPASAGRVPPVVRLDPSLRRLLLRRLVDEPGLQQRLLLAMEAFTAGGWLRYEEVRRAMGGEAVAVHAVETGTARYAAEFSRNAPINDAAQVDGPNFFSGTAVILPADLYDAVREAFLLAHTGYFDLAAEPPPAEALRLEWIPLEPGGQAEAERAQLVRSLQLIAERAANRPPR